MKSIETRSVEHQAPGIKDTRFSRLRIFLVITTFAALGPDRADAVVFVSNYLERGTRQTQPRPEQLTDVVRITAAPGEYEPAAVSVCADKLLEGVQLALAGPLTSDAGRMIPVEAVTIRLADPFESWTGKKELEQFLLQARMVDIAAGTTRRFWLTVKVPPDALPGTYRAVLLVSKPMGKLEPDLWRLQTLKRLSFEVEVLPIRLASAADTGMAWFMYNDTAYYAKGPGGAEALINEDYQSLVFEDMREHGMTTATLYLYPEADGKPVLDQRSENHLSMVATMAMLEKSRLVAPGLPVVWLGAECYGPGIWDAVNRARQQRKWPELLYYAVDEPEEEDRNRRARVFMRRFNAYRQKHRDFDLRVTTALGSSCGIQKLGYAYDLWIACMGQRSGETGVIADAKMRQKELWTYDCMAAPVDAEMDRYYFGVWAWVSGVRGCSHWAYYDAKPKLSYIYPGPDGPIPTVGWEAVREGIDDYRYLFTLRQWSDRAVEAGRVDLVERAEEVFAQAHAMVTMDNYGRAFLAASGLPGEASAYARSRVEPEMPIDAYDALRRSAAERIQELADVLGESTD